MLKNINSTKIAWHLIPCVAFVMWIVFCISPNLGYDEAYTVGLISRSFGDIMEITKADVHPPMYYFLVKVFYEIFGGGAAYWSLKVFSLIFAMGYLLLGKYYVRKLFGEAVSIYFMLISILTPIMLTQVGNARMYTYALFFMTWSNLIAIDVVKNPTKKKWLIFLVCSVFTVYSHTYTMMQLAILYIILFFVFVYQRKLQEVKSLCILGMIVSIAYIPWLRVTYMQASSKVSETGGGVVRDFNALLELIKGYKNEWFSMLELPDYNVIRVLLIIVSMMCIFSFWAVYKKKEYVIMMGIIAVFVTVLIGTGMSRYMGQGFLVRYVFSGLGAYALFLAVGICYIKPLLVRGVVIASIVPFFFTHYKEEFSLEYTNGLSEYMAYVDEYVGIDDAIIGPTEHTIFLSVYYPEIQHFIYGYKPDFLPFANVEAFKEWSQLDGVNTLWFLCFEDRDPSVFKDSYTYEEVLLVEHMNYTFKLYKLTEI